MPSTASSGISAAAASTRRGQSPGRWSAGKTGCVTEATEAHALPRGPYFLPFTLRFQLGRQLSNDGFVPPVDGSNAQFEELGNFREAAARQPVVENQT